MPSPEQVPMNSSLRLENEDATEALARKLAASAAGAGKFRVIGLDGPVGAGKTTFARSFFDELGSADYVTSPTYTLIHEYFCDSLGETAYHLDFYRLSGEVAAEELGLRELFASRKIAVVEWAEKFPRLLPPDSLWIRLEIDGNTRIANLRGPAL